MIKNQLKELLSEWKKFKVQLILVLGNKKRNDNNTFHSRVKLLLVIETLMRYLTLVRVDLLGVRFAVGEFPPPHLLIKNLLQLCYKLEIWYVSIHPYLVSENIPENIHVP